MIWPQGAWRAITLIALTSREMRRVAEGRGKVARESPGAGSFQSLVRDSDGKEYMVQIEVTKPIYDLWHVARQIRESNAYTGWEISLHDGTPAVHISEAILKVWHQAHSYQEQLMECIEQKRHRNKQI